MMKFKDLYETLNEEFLTPIKKYITYNVSKTMLDKKPIMWQVRGKFNYIYGHVNGKYVEIMKTPVTLDIDTTKDILKYIKTLSPVDFFIQGKEKVKLSSLKL